MLLLLLLRASGGCRCGGIVSVTTHLVRYRLRGMVVGADVQCGYVYFKSTSALIECLLLETTSKWLVAEVAMVTVVVLGFVS